MHKTIAVNFDINAVKKNAFSEYYSSGVTEKGNELEVYEVTVGEGMYLMHGTVIPKEKKYIQIEARNDYVYFVFVLDNRRSYAITNSSNTVESITVSALQQMAFIMKKGSYIRLSLDANKPSTVFEMSFSVDYLLNILPQKHFLYDRLASSKRTNTTSLLFDRPIVLDTKLKSILYDMLYCRYTEVAKSLYIKGKLLEFFALQQLHKETKILSSGIFDISFDERKRMFQAREILHANLRVPPTIVELARLLGTNECYLKQNFKIVFGSTIHGYVKQVKMERARKLLMQQKNISEVARVTGYKHANHFSTAFKKHFGYVPNKVG